jgi:hypothetical protein
MTVVVRLIVCLAAGVGEPALPTTGNFAAVNAGADVQRA